LPEEGEPITLEGQSALILLGGSLALARTKPRKKRVSEE
jgi:hypothetical protein